MFLTLQHGENPHRHADSTLKEFQSSTTQLHWIQAEIFVLHIMDKINEAMFPCKLGELTH